MSADAQLTPMMAQYRRIKSELPKDALLLFRLGDFYEMFFEDAQTGAQLLNVALTKRGVIPMCGIPFHAANAYIGRLLRAGRKVAICDQMEEARPGQLVKRAVTQILSPGTHFDERMLNAERNNYLAAIYSFGQSRGLAFVDITTGGFRATELENDSALLAELDRLRPAEIVYPSEDTGLTKLLGNPPLAPPGRGTGAPTSAAHSAPAPGGAGGGSAPNRGWVVDGYEDWVFAPETAQFTVRDHVKVATLDGLGLKDRAAAVGAAGAVLPYLTPTLPPDAAPLPQLSFYQSADSLVLAGVPLSNLEILAPL